MRRSWALIAVGAAVAVAAVVVVAGMTSGDDGVAAGTVTEALPSGHPSVAAESKPAEDPAPDAGVEDTIARLEGQRAEDPADMDVLVKLGEAYFMGQRLQLARQAYDEVIQQDPDNAAAQVGLAMVLHAKGESGRAEKSLRAVLDAHPDNQARALLAGHHPLLRRPCGRGEERMADGRPARSQLDDGQALAELRRPARGPGLGNPRGG